jgi:HipA-like protein
MFIGRENWSEGFGEPSETRIHFSYDHSWVEAKKPMISFSMPVREEVYQEEAQSFFGNLLPEGDFRRRVEQIFKVSSDNDFSLIKEIGGDCAGALSIGYDEGNDEETFYEAVSHGQLRCAWKEYIHTAWSGKSQPGTLL